MFPKTDIAADLARGRRVAQVLFCAAGIALLAAAYFFY
jgi:hypothetical protein